ncbi:DUF4240 domain-containing protein [Pseudoalteromonas aurantia]|uniref:DUF4240 domain-containing protein n=2 Tax=Pseudoalteromonas TaxID=53246 RepID=A0A5S3VBG2_9GAMM|nr:DUF4240 domain-containing protein [Pseudoalteromonas aurantia]TMO64140.1 hypothetical protein CWC18_07125 [Pseudoalteromonas aurantia]TMO69356.1 hypothetical protein CWC19_05355 [Pseudoalteromonas aurantia]TMO75429.1 hypothetical protein CWC20_07860 [Pseudoalteromonas aurantia]
MNLDLFWQTITIDVDINEKNFHLKSQLEALSNDDIKAFDTHYNAQLRRLWHWDIWGAAYVTCGCNTEYDFLDFCNWILTQGPDVVENIITDPDSLSSLAKMPLKDALPYPYSDELDLVAGLLYEEKTNEELPYHNVVNFAPQGKKFKSKPKLLKQTYPQLFDKYWKNK